MTGPPEVLRGRDVWARLDGVTELRAWEGGVAFLAELDGRPCFATDESALADFIAEEDDKSRAGPRPRDHRRARRLRARVGAAVPPRRARGQLVDAFREGRIGRPELEAAMDDLNAFLPFPA